MPGMVVQGRERGMQPGPGLGPFQEGPDLCKVSFEDCPEQNDLLNHPAILRDSTTCSKVSKYLAAFLKM